MPRVERHRLSTKRILQWLAFAPLWPLIWVLGVVPLSVLYVVSDGLRWVVFDRLGYRRRVVTENIARAFPAKPLAEREQIRRDFERNLIDNFLEALPLRYGRRSTVLSRISHTLSPEARAVIDRHPRVAVGQGHLGQLDWSCYIARALAIPTYYVYKELEHPDFDRLMYETRSRTGSVLYEMGDSKEFIASKQNQRAAFVFIADQSPMAGRGVWVDFLAQPTAFYEGLEKFARLYQMPVLYHAVRQLGRGRYAWTVEVLAEDPSALPPGGVIQAYAHRLEREIIEQPALWWWSHKRWKHTPPADYQPPITARP